MKNLGVVFILLFSTIHSFAQQTFTVEKLWDLNRLGGTVISPNEQYAFYSTTHYELSTNKGKTTGFLLDLKTQQTKEIFSAGSSFFNVVWSPSNTLLFARGTEKGSEIVEKTISTNTDKILYSGSAELEGFTISADGKTLVTLEPVKVRQTIADKYPDLNLTNGRLETGLMYRHWNVWQSPYALHLFVHQLEGTAFGKGIDVLQGETYSAVTPPFGGIDDVTLSADGTEIYYATKKKNGTDFALSTNGNIYCYNVKTGITTTLSDQHLGYNTLPRLNNTGNLLAELAMEKDGNEADKNNLWIHDLATGKQSNLTQNLDVSVEHYQWHPSGKTIYFTAAIKGTKQLFEVVLATGKTRQVTNERCDIVGLNVLKNTAIVERQTMLAPTDIWEVQLTTGTQKQLTKVNEDKLKGLAIPTVEEKWVTTTDGKKMLVWMILPPNMDKTKKHPALLYCQGGPQSALSQYFSYRWNFYLMAAQGYVVIAPNRRGMPGHGQAWNDQISRDWGGQAIQDYLVATDSAAILPYVDATKIAAVGASYGGYSVYYLAGMHNNRFKTFVSHCGLFNLESWYGTTEEVFFAKNDIGEPYWTGNNKTQFAKHSPHEMVDKWNTPMLVIHGGKDFRVPESEGMQAFQVLQMKGIPSEFLYFPDEGHWISKPQNGVLWYRSYFDWLGRYLK